MEGQDATGIRANGASVDEAPSRRAQILRDEILGSALTLDEAAYVLSLDRTTVAKYLRERTLLGFQIGREWLIPEDELRAYVRRMVRDVAQPRADLPVHGDHPGIMDRVKRDLLRGGKRLRAEPHAGKGSHDAARFDTFTRRARRALEYAQEEAHDFRHPYLGTEHLLLGLLREGRGVAARVLANLGVDSDRVRSGVEFVVGRGEQALSGEVGLTARTKKAIELAADEARRLGHRYIGTEHLLLGLLREGEGVAGGVLESLGVALETARTETLRLIAALPERSDEAPTIDPPPVPEEAEGLVPDGAVAGICPTCGARNPAYFRHCFNCGIRLESDT